MVLKKVFCLILLLKLVCVSLKKGREVVKTSTKIKGSSDDYQIWDYSEFRKRLSLSRDTFQYI